MVFCRGSILVLGLRVFLWSLVWWLFWVFLRDGFILGFWRFCLRFGGRSDRWWLESCCSCVFGSRCWRSRSFLGQRWGRGIHLAGLISGDFFSWRRLRRVCCSCLVLVGSRGLVWVWICGLSSFLGSSSWAIRRWGCCFVWFHWGCVPSRGETGFCGGGCRLLCIWFWLAIVCSVWFRVGTDRVWGRWGCWVLSCFLADCWYYFSRGRGIISVGKWKEEGLLWDCFSRGSVILGRACWRRRITRWRRCCCSWGLVFRGAAVGYCLWECRVVTISFLVSLGWYTSWCWGASRWLWWPSVLGAVAVWRGRGRSVVD